MSAKHVDAAEPSDSGLHRSLRIAALRDIQLDGQQVVRLSQDFGHTLTVSARRHERMAGG